MRRTSYKGKYKLSKHEFYVAYHAALCPDNQIISDAIVECVKEAGEDIFIWLFEAVTHENVTYTTLRMRDNPIPCGKNQYYEKRRKFYYLLFKRIMGIHGA